MIRRRDPCHPTEEREDLKQVVGEPEVDEHRAKGPHEEFISGNTEDLLKRAWDGVVNLVVQRRIQRDGHERSRPDTVGRVHDEASSDAYNDVSPATK
jgi:hypothetical protein